MTITDKQVEAAQDAYRKHIHKHGVPWGDEAMRAALEAADAAAWDGMETAPRDGTEVLVWGRPQDKDDVQFTRESAFTAYWDDVDGTFCLSGSDWQGPFIEPTHWRPIPASTKGE